MLIGFGCLLGWADPGGLRNDFRAESGDVGSGGDTLRDDAQRIQLLRTGGVADQ